MLDIELTSAPSVIIEGAVELSPQRWARLVFESDLITGDFENGGRNSSEQDEEGRLIHHVGGRCFVDISDGHLEFLNAEADGDYSVRLILTLEEWHQLMDELKPKIDRHLGPSQPCYLDDSHNNQMGMFECLECNPFPEYE